MLVQLLDLEEELKRGTHPWNVPKMVLKLHSSTLHRVFRYPIISE
jgi:hypothetical protein